ncbi:hypothetical protein DFJ77DRAFT_425495 [Powellomyces hirtus]|nr:hypothetical protein DFJ77DRAFT_425495 [Powellomyces hirtus]
MTTTYDDIFGGSDSELDDVALSDDEDDIQEKAHEKVAAASSGDEDFSPGKLPSFKKKSTRQVDVSDDLLRRPKKKISRGKARHARAEGSDNEEREAPPRELSPTSQRRQEAHDDVDAAMRKGKRKKVAPRDEADLDEIMVRVLAEMRNAAEQDKERNRKRQPAVAKLMKLPGVMLYLQREALHEQFLENHILEGIKLWLEPLPDAALPSLDIQTNMFQVLQKMPIGTSHLRESLIGRIVNFYAKCPRVNGEVQKIASQLVDKWMRPILNRSNSYRDYDVSAMADLDDGFIPQAPAPRTAVKEEDDRKITRARIPQRIAPAFTVIPQSYVPPPTDGKPKVLVWT